MNHRLLHVPMGVVPYGQALALQLDLRRKLQSGELEYDGVLITLQHPPTVTLGKRGHESDLVGRDLLRERGVEIFRIDRGGEATYHGPGQLVVYPVFKLEPLGLGVVDLVRGIATALAETLLRWGVAGHYDKEHPGVWTVDESPSRKIASVGMRISGGVSTHGAAINLVNDMIPFGFIVPCGMPNAPMSRLQDYVDQPVDVDLFTRQFVEQFVTDFGWTVEEGSLELPAESNWEQALTDW